MNGIAKQNIIINRKMLSDIAVNDEASFKELIKKIS